MERIYLLSRGHDLLWSTVGSRLKSASAAKVFSHLSFCSSRSLSLFFGDQADDGSSESIGKAATAAAAVRVLGGDCHLAICLQFQSGVKLSKAKVELELKL